jgi:putative Mg2+ transporter-C (MgtC) family protein
MVDPTRIAAQIVSGIGFIGAGTILQHRGSVRGLTTAASLWAVAAIGTAAGAGLLVMAVVGTVLILVVLAVLDQMEEFLRRRLNIPVAEPKPGEDPEEGRTEDLP